jgi:DUF4097 and DUF4098 domain-containing protein YvlB
MKKQLLLLCLLAFFATVSLGQEFDYSFKETYEVSTPAKLDLSSFDGDLDIIPSDGNKILVYYIAKKGGRRLKINRAELEKDIIIDVDHTKNDLRISVRTRHENRGFSFDMSMGVAFKVYVPKDISCNLRTSDGSISLEKLNGDQSCKTSDGAINISTVAGDVYGRTSDGDVHIKQIKGPVDVGTSDGTITLSAIAGNVDATTSDGNIKLDRVKGNIAVRTSDGYIDFHEISGSFKASTSDGSIKGNVVDLKNELTLKTSDGNIDVTIPSQLGLDLDIKGESLDVPFKNFSGKFDEKHVRGQANGGGIPVVLSTSGGNVTLHY